MIFRNRLAPLFNHLRSDLMDWISDRLPTQEDADFGCKIYLHWDHRSEFNGEPYIYWEKITLGMKWRRSDSLIDRLVNSSHGPPCDTDKDACEALHHVAQWLRLQEYLLAGSSVDFANLIQRAANRRNWHEFTLLTELSNGLDF